jgi:hypothetical protein
MCRCCWRRIVIVLIGGAEARMGWEVEGVLDGWGARLGWYTSSTRE